MTEGPKATPGYYIEKDSVVQGVNEVTGMSFLYYTEKLLVETPQSQYPSSTAGILNKKQKKEKNQIKNARKASIRNLRRAF